MAKKANQTDLFKEGVALATPATDAEIRAAKAIRKAGALNNRLYRCAYGPQGEMLLLELIDPATGQSVIPMPGFSFLYAGGLLSGFRCFDPATGLTELEIDYSRLGEISRQNAAGVIKELFSLGNSRRDRLVSGTTFQKLYARLAAMDPGRLMAADQAQGINDARNATRATPRTRHRIACAIFAAMCRNFLQRHHAPAMAFFNTLPPSRVPAFTWMLTHSNPQPVIDVLAQNPITIAFPANLARFFAAEGWARRDICDDLGVARQIHLLEPKTIGSILYLFGVQARPHLDVPAADLRWINEKALKVCPPEMFRQKLGILIAGRVYRADRNDPARAASILEWAWKHSSALANQAQFRVAETPIVTAWINADEFELGEAGGIRKWTPEISLAAAMEASRSLAAYHQARDLDGAGDIQFPFDGGWMPVNASLPNSSTRIIRIDTVAMLLAEARRNNNCAYDFYRHEAGRGVCAIYVLRRAANKRDRIQSTFYCADIGGEAVNQGMARIYRGPDGKPYIEEIRGPSNRSIDPEIRAAFERLLADASA